MPDKLAHYELAAPIGAGGMGEVYRAKDTRLDRDVAIKILPEVMAKDPERIARFDREARTLASLKHANIATVHDFMTVDGTSFLVMELVEGEDLSERLEKGRIDPDEARQIAIQLAAGLEAAHERNIVHRDLKPANVRLTPDGQVKILDFGLARAVTGDGEDGSDPMLSPTITQAMTQAGTILGTAAYMSPEQARGKTVDKRADIWAFGVLLYEMLTGERLFEGETTSDTLASVLKNSVDFEQLDQSVPHDMVWVLQRCLDRNPTRRLRDIGEARLVLTGDSTISQMGMRAAEAEPARRSGFLWPAIALLLALGLAASFFMRSGGGEVLQIRAALPIPEDVNLVLGTSQPGPPALSPDGTAVVFTGRDPEGGIRLWYRRIDSPEARPLEGTAGASYPFWSPDSRSVAFFGDEALMRLDIGSGSPLRLASCQFGKGGSWNERGNIVYAPSYNVALAEISAGGGDLPRAVTSLDSMAGDNSHRHPEFLPDGEHFIYLARGARDSTGAVANSLRVGSLSGDVQQYVTGADGHGQFHAGHLLFARDGALVAQPFDVSSFALTGDPRVILPNVESLGAATRSVVSVSESGMMIYVEPFLGGAKDFVTIYDRQGNALSQVGDAAAISIVDVSPDRTRAAVVIGDGSAIGSHIWILDLETGTRSRFAGGGDGNNSPVWSPDGRMLAYAQAQERGSAVVVRRVDGGGSPIHLVSDDNKYFEPESWSPSGRFLTYTGDFQGIGIIELDAKGNPVGERRDLVHKEIGAAWGSVFLGRDEWIVYHSSAAGKFELFVGHIDDPSRHFQITSTGAIFPTYNRVTGEIAYSQLGTNELTTIKVSFADADSDPIFSTPVTLFRLPMGDLDDKVDFHGDTIVLASSPASDAHTLPMLITDWRRLLRD